MKNDKILMNFCTHCVTRMMEQFMRHNFYLSPTTTNPSNHLPSILIKFSMIEILFEKIFRLDMIEITSEIIGMCTVKCAAIINLGRLLLGNSMFKKFKKPAESWIAVNIESWT